MKSSIPLNLAFPTLDQDMYGSLLNQCLLSTAKQKKRRGEEREKREKEVKEGKGKKEKEWELDWQYVRIHKEVRGWRLNVTDVHDPVTATVVVVAAATAVVLILIEEIKGQHRKKFSPSPPITQTQKTQLLKLVWKWP